jgi:endonuclease YncB( thermonuclease family)
LKGDIIFVSHDKNVECLTDRNPAHAKKHPTNGITLLYNHFSYNRHIFAQVLIKGKVISIADGDTITVLQNRCIKHEKRRWIDQELATTSPYLP